MKAPRHHGIKYEEGLRVVADMNAAAEWYQKAAAYGFQNAIDL